MIAAVCPARAEPLQQPYEGQTPERLLAKDFTSDGKMILDSFISPVTVGDTGSATIVTHYENDEKNGAVLPNPPFRQHFTKQSGEWKVCEVSPG